MRQLLAGRQVSIRLTTRLEAAGLVHQDTDGQYHMACRLYADFFGKVFGWIEKVEKLYSLIKETLNKKILVEYKTDPNHSNL